MKRSQTITVVLAYLASVCFFISYIIHFEILYFILGSAWFCIASAYFSKVQKK